MLLLNVETRSAIKRLEFKYLMKIFISMFLFLAYCLNFITPCCITKYASPYSTVVLDQYTAFTGSDRVNGLQFTDEDGLDGLDDDCALLRRVKQQYLTNVKTRRKSKHISDPCQYYTTHSNSNLSRGVKCQLKESTCFVVQNYYFSIQFLQYKFSFHEKIWKRH